MSFQLSDRARELIPKARMVSFANLQTRYTPEVLAQLQQADDTGQYLQDGDLDALMGSSAGGESAGTAQVRMAQARSLREAAAELVTQARQHVLSAYPGIAEVGGDLYPTLRAEACWRDFWHFLRCVTYAIATGEPEFTSDEGLGYMNQLYQELKVPLAAMVTGLEALKQASLEHLERSQLGEEGATTVIPAFDHLIIALGQFR